MKTKIAQVKARTQRRREKGIEPNADDMWAYINKSWPTMSEENREKVFQGASP